MSYKRKGYRPTMEPTALLIWFRRYATTEDELIDRCTSTHPDHETLSEPVDGERQFWQAWCSICRAHGWDKTGPANPEMSAERIAAYDKEWTLALPAPEPEPEADALAIWSHD